ncbi:MAG: cupin domain-containing protein [Clostridiales bacterium]|nr:cupin domain-containing protein [Clostridiales bacterium]
MIIDFDKIDFEKKTEFLGGQKNFFVRSYKDDMNNIMSDRLEPGASIGYHKHEMGSEIIYIIKGSGKVLYDNKEEAVKEGQCHYCPKGHFHSLINNSESDLYFFAVVTNQ